MSLADVVMAAFRSVSVESEMQSSLSWLSSLTISPLLVMGPGEAAVTAYIPAPGYYENSSTTDAVPSLAMCSNCRIAKFDNGNET